MRVIESLLATSFVDVLGRVLVHSIWQGTAVALTLALVLWLLNLWLLHGVSPNLRYNIAVFFMIIFIFLPVFTYKTISVQSSPTLTSTKQITTPMLAEPPHALHASVVSETPNTPDVRSVNQTEERHQTSVNVPFRWKNTIEPLLPWAVVAWILGVVILSLRLMLGLRLVHRLRSSFTGSVPSYLEVAAKRIAKSLQLEYKVTLYTSRIVDVPMVVGYLKPVILIPISTLSGLTAKQLEMIVAHELAHIRRFDHLVNLLQTVTEILFFFNPALWWISSQIRQEREYCCDALAVRACGVDNLDYAKALATLTTTRSIPTALAADGGSLVKRIFKLTGQALTAKRTPNPLHWLGGVALIVLSLFIASVALAQTQGGTLRIGFADITQLDPYKSAGGELAVFSMVFDSLVIPSPEDFSPLPHLAESWETPDDTTWIFKLREGVTFQDGNAVFAEGVNREVTAEDVVYSINRFIEVSSAFTLGEIASVTALDTYRVELKTLNPDPFLISDPNRLARVGIVPREAIEQLGEEEFARSPVGSGPFELVSFVPAEKVELTRNEDYWIMPNLDGVEFVYTPDPTVETIALEAGDIDVVTYLFNVDSVTQLSENPDLTLLEGAGSYRGLGFNVTTAPFDDFAVRDAISKAVDIDAAIAAVVAPYGTRAYGQVPYWFEWTEDPELPALWSYDPDAALAQLTEAGFSDSDGDGILDRDGEPLSFNIKTLAGSHVRVLTILVTQLKELGIDANILQQDGAVWGEDLQKGNDTGLFFDYSFASTTGLYSLFHGKNVTLTNTHFYDNPEVNALLDEASSTLDFEQRNASWLEAQRLIMADRAAIPLYFEPGYSAVRSNVKDFVPMSAGLYLVSTENNVYLEE
jgi:peptide/nickel transport system substrate-binding protein